MGKVLYDLNTNSGNSGGIVSTTIPLTTTSDTVAFQSDTGVRIDIVQLQKKVEELEEMVNLLILEVMPERVV